MFFQSKLRFIFICILFVSVLPSLASGSDSLQKSKLSVLPLPTFGYTPETRVYAGAVAQFSFKMGSSLTTRSSAIKMEFQYTQNMQVIAELSGTLFTPDEKTLINFVLHRSKFPEYYWGIGDRTPESYKTLLNNNRSWIDLSVLFRIRQKWFAGPLFRNQSRVITLPTNIDPFSLNGYQRGGQLLHDSRNSILNPRAGQYFDLQLSLYKSGVRGFRILSEYRRYIHIGKIGILATRAAFSWLNANANYFDLALLGGDRWLRGYYAGRFRDRGLYVLNAEFRQPIYRRWGFALGMGAGSVFQQPKQVLSNQVKPALNVGIRFLADRKEKINLRIDYAAGIQGQRGFYFAFGEAF